MEQNLQFGTSIRALPSGSGSACPNRNHNLQWRKLTFPTSSSGTWQVKIGFTKFQSCHHVHFQHPFTPLPKQELFVFFATSHPKPHLLHWAHQHALVGQNTTYFGILWGNTRLRSFQVNLNGKKRWSIDVHSSIMEPIFLMEPMCCFKTSGFFTYLATHEKHFPPLFRFWWFRPTAGNVFPTAGSFPPALWLIFGSHGSSKVVSPQANSSNDPSGTDELDLQQQSTSQLIPSLHPSPSKPSLHFAPQEAAKNGTTSTLETPSTFDLSSPSALGATLVSEFCWPNLWNKKQWKHRCTASNLNISKHIFKYNQGTAWKTRKTPALQLLRMAHTSQDGQHFILPNLRRRFFHTKSCDTGRCLSFQSHLGPDVPI